MSATQLGSTLLGPDGGHVTRASLATSTQGASGQSASPAAPGSLSSLLDRFTGSSIAEATPSSPSAGSRHCTDLAVPGQAQCQIPGPGSDSEAVSGGEDAPAGALVEPLQVSEGALRYGLQMLQRSGGALRPQIVIDNSYERRLLAGANLLSLPLHMPNQLMSRLYQSPVCLVVLPVPLQSVRFFPGV